MAVTITAANLRAIAGGKAPLAASVADSFNKLAAPFGLTTSLRCAHFLAQLAHESRFQWVKEIWGPTPAQKRYEGRKDLGNTQPGDGKRFMGHGLIQITGRANHVAFTAWIKRRYPEAPDFEDEPEKLAEFPWALMGAFWFWDTRGLNALADADDVLAITKKINGGTNGLADRKAALKRAKTELGMSDAPARAPAPVAPSKPKSDRMSIPANTWAEDGLADFEIRAIQQRLRDLGFYQVGKVDGKIGPSFKAALLALQATAGIVEDGHWGPQTKEALSAQDAKGQPLNKRKIDPARANTTAKDLRKQGSTIAIEGSRVTWASVFGLVLALIGAAQAAYNAPADLPFGSSILLGLIPPPFGSIVSAVLPYLMAFVPMAYAALASQGIVRARVVAEQTGLHNGEPAPAPTDEDEPSDAPKLGGWLGSIFGR